MAMPPIISNSPLFKALKGSGSDRAEPQSNSAPVATSSGDNVDISAAVQNRIGDVQTLTPEQATQVSGDTAELLADSDLALGLDPSIER